jgi:hypothetical protein
MRLDLGLLLIEGIFLQLEIRGLLSIAADSGREARDLLIRYQCERSHRPPSDLAAPR